MEGTQERLASLIGSRICHDLISPIGAVTNGLELMELAGLPKGPEIDLVNQSAQNAAARIKYYRLAFGDCGRIDADHTVNRDDVIDILRNVYLSDRLTVQWHVTDDRSRVETKAALLALMCAEVALGSGGTVYVTVQDQHWYVIGKGPKLTVQGTPWDILRGDVSLASVAPSAVQFALLPDLLAQLDRALSISHEEGCLTLRF